MKALFLGMILLVSAQTLMAVDNPLWVCIHSTALGTTECIGDCDSGKIPFNTCGHIRGYSYGYWVYNASNDKASFWVFYSDDSCSHLGDIAFIGTVDCGATEKCSTIDYNGVPVPISYDCDDADALAPIILMTILSVVIMAFC